MASSVENTNTTKPFTIVIIGSAGRLADAKYVCSDNYQWIIKDVELKLREHYPYSQDAFPENLCLMSGGAAFVDHVAVALKLKYPQIQLHLCLPAEWDSEKNEFKDTGVRDFRVNPGGTSNYYHRNFSQSTGIASLLELAQVMPSSILETEFGFSSRNSLLAGKVDLLLAYTFSNTDRPSSTGTLSTWTKSKAMKKIHTSIPLMKS